MKKRFKLINYLTKLLFIDEYNCIVCGKETPVSDCGVCPDCAVTMHEIGLNACVKCGKPMKNEAKYCLCCQNSIRHFTLARSVYPYSGGAAAIIRNLKFNNKRYLAKFVARKLAKLYLAEGFECDYILPVPISAKREKERGYNQMVLVGEYLEEILGIPLAREMVYKYIDTPPQARLSGKERQNSVAGAYQIIDKDKVFGARILIIDDVLTTGATINEIAGALISAKARGVYALTYANAEYKLLSESNYEPQDG